MMDGRSTTTVGILAVDRDGSKARRLAELIAKHGAREVTASSALVLGPDLTVIGEEYEVYDEHVQYIEKGEGQ